MPTNILIVDDEPSIIDNLVYALKQEGMTTSSANSGEQALHLLDENRFDLVVLDIGLPDTNGIEVCKRIRADSDIPIIFLTARSDEIDRILGLELGADDYVTKPFSPREVTARIKTILRRVTSPREEGTSSLFNVNDSKKDISFQGSSLTLTPFEYGILSKLLSRPGQVFSRDSLLDQVWKDDTDASDRVIDTHIKTIRAKIQAIDSTASPIKTHRGFGYSVEDQ